MAWARQQHMDCGIDRVTVLWLYAKVTFEVNRTSGLTSPFIRPSDTRRRQPHGRSKRQLH
jgi:hypothetical protein